MDTRKLFTPWLWDVVLGLCLAALLWLAPDDTFIRVLLSVMFVLYGALVAAGNYYQHLLKQQIEVLKQYSGLDEDENK